MLLHGYKQSMSESKEALEIGILEGSFRGGRTLQIEGTLFSVSTLLTF